MSLFLLVGTPRFELGTPCTINKASLFIRGSTHEIVRALAYSQGVAKTALGSDDEQNILLVALLNRMGLPGTRGGTNLSAAMTL